MSISYTGNIPLGSHSPASDQPNMLNNTNAINNIIGIDHITFNAQAGDTSGQHKQITFNGLLTPAAPSDPKSVLYNAAGVSDPTHPELFWRNSQSPIPISCIRAFGSFVNGTTTFLSQYNCVSVTNLNVVTLSPNIFVNSGAIKPAVIASDSSALGVTYTLVGSTLTFSIVGGSTISFVILQI